MKALVNQREPLQVPELVKAHSPAPSGVMVPSFSERVACVSVMLQAHARCPGAVKEPLPTQHRAISQVQPEVLPKVAPSTLPTTVKSSEDS